MRGEGGYVVAPPSLHYTGKRYTWELSSHPDDIELAQLPEAWIQALAKPAPSTKATNSIGKGRSGRTLAQVLNGVPHGQRDTELARYVGQKISQNLTRAEIEALVIEAGENCDPPFPKKGALAKVDSIFRTHKMNHPDYQEPTIATESQPNLTDMGNAQRLARLFGDKIRYCKALGPWLVYDGKRWAPDALDAVQGYAKQVSRAIYAEAAEELDEERHKMLMNFARKCEAAHVINNMITLLPDEPGIGATVAAFDQDPFLLNVLNGTIDPRTEELRPHPPDDMITKLAPVKYDPDAKCPRWEQFLDEIMDGDSDLVAYLRRFAGYSLTSDTRERAWAFFWGQGSNGKSVFVKTLQGVLGDYAFAAPGSTFLQRKNDDGARGDIAMMRGARLVISGELREGRFDSELLKHITGGDTVTARQMYRDFFQFVPECKIIVCGNNKPAVRDQTDSFWQRLHLVPFTRQFVGDDQDNTLSDKLKAESSGILNWALRGCLEWQRSGLNPPESVRDAVQAYRDDADLLGDFIETRCVLSPDAFVSVSKLRPEYVKYCRETETPDIGLHAFNKAILAHKGVTKGKMGPSEKPFKAWRGIGLLTEQDSGNVVQGSFRQDSCPDCDLKSYQCPVEMTRRQQTNCRYFHTMSGI